MRVLPCNPEKGLGCKEGYALLPDRSPYILQSFPSTFRGEAYRYVDARCGKATKLTLLDFNRLPRLSPADLREMKGAPTWEGTLGLKPAEADDLHSAGLTPQDVVDLSR